MNEMRKIMEHIRNPVNEQEEDNNLLYQDSDYNVYHDGENYIVQDDKKEITVNLDKGIYKDQNGNNISRKVIIDEYPGLIDTIIDNEGKEGLIEKDPFLGLFLFPQNEKAQKLSVEKDGTALKFIENPDKDIQKIAIKNNIHAIEFIEKPSTEIQKFAIRKDPDGAVRYMQLSNNGPSEKVKKWIERNYPNVLKNKKIGRR